MQQEHTAGLHGDWLQFMILTTKLELPPLPVDTMDRPRLSSQHKELFQSKVTLLTAPAGSGKSTLLGSWVRNEEAHVACVCLDDKDQDPLQFWLYIIHALDRVREGFCGDVLPHFMQRYPIDPRSALILLLNRVAQANQHVLLILDDYHAVTRSEIHEQMQYFIENLPLSVHLVLSSRTYPPFKLEKLRLRGELKQVTLQELAFTEEEGIEYCQEIMQLDIAGQEARGWVQQTEGWAAGLKLFALSQGSHAEEWVNPMNSISSSLPHEDQVQLGEKTVSDYLLEEVFQRQSPEMQQFLLRTSITRRMNSSLCQVLSDMVDAPQMLRQLEREHLFLIPLDREAHWYRYHHLFSAFLKRELARCGSEQVNELHAIAALWYEQQGYPAEALDHYILGQHMQDAARLLEELFAHFIMGEWWTLRRYFDVLPLEIVKAHPKLYMSYLFLVAREMPYGQMVKQLDELEHVIRVHLQGQLEPEIIGYLLQVICVMRAYMAYLNRDLDGLAHYLVSYIDQGYPDDIAFQYMDYDRRESMRLRSFHGVNGYLRRGEACFGAITTRWYAEHAYVTSYYGVGYGEILMEQDRIAEAVGYADRALEVALQIKVAALLVPAYVLKARLELILGRPEEGLKLLQQVSGLLSVKDMDYWQPALSAHQYRILLEMSPVETAQTILDKPASEGGMAAEISCDQIFHSMVRIRAMIVLEQYDHAREELRRIRKKAEERDWLTEQVECALLESILLQKQGFTDASIATLSRALVLGGPEGYIRSFVAEGDRMKQLLQQYLYLCRTKEIQDHGVKMAYVKQLISAFAKDKRGRSRSSLGEAKLDSKEVGLSPMEQKIFGHIAEGLTSKQIAAEFGISPGTVNTHIRRVFAKLGASSRTHAVQIAEQRGLL
ncbi:LuxR C-terminal-related transcriptional regulator [Paenibacillus xylanexedens]|uniref:LuxR C-terminal-related transcriptional regulator n=1 Tax=Paenibacillus xylanexedens TaxID=528191 RepID=UPI00164358A9|nr:LuxR C-terminal-related transcriptional regulator [Paenibacillus xylanexedens]